MGSWDLIERHNIKPDSPKYLLWFSKTAFPKRGLRSTLPMSLRMVRTIRPASNLESWYINLSYRILGGKIKDRYFESTGGINVRLKLQWHTQCDRFHWLCIIDKGFSAIIEYFNTFKTFRADEINYIGTVSFSFCYLKLRLKSCVTNIQKLTRKLLFSSGQAPLNN